MPVYRINQFPEGSGSLTSDDVFLFMDDPSGSGITKKISLIQLNSAISPTISNSGDNRLLTSTGNSINAESNLTFDGSVLTVSGIVNNASFKNYKEQTVTTNITAGVLTIDLNQGNIFLVTLNSNITTLNITNIDNTVNRSQGFTLILTSDGNNRTIQWPVNIKWSNNSSPVLTNSNSKIDVLSFISIDNGTSWLGFVGGQSF